MRVIATHPEAVVRCSLRWAHACRQRHQHQNVAPLLAFRLERARTETAQFGRQIVVPGLHPSLSGRRVLTMDFEGGCDCSDKQQIEALGLVPRDVAMLLAEVFGHMVCACSLPASAHFGGMHTSRGAAHPQCPRPCMHSCFVVCPPNTIFCC